MNVGAVSLAINGAGVFVFGLVATVAAGNDLHVVSTGVASIGMGLFGFAVATIPFRRRERWAWFILWYYPLFWSAHLFGELPPGKDHVHQIVFIVLSFAGLLLPAREFFPGIAATPRE